MFQNKKVGVIIPAAGSGNRFGGGVAKQFLSLDGKTVLSRTLNQFQIHSAVDCIAIAGSQEGIEQITSIVQQESFSKVCWIGLGGSFRQDSVWNALEALKSFAVDIVLVHDAVRPFVSSEIINRVLDAVVRVDAALPVVKPKDTIKLADEQQFVHETPERERLYIAQTPQGFSFEVLLSAFQKAKQDKFIGTDDASLIERLNIPVKMVEGNYDNFKITTREDLAVAELLVKQRMNS